MKAWTHIRFSVPDQARVGRGLRPAPFPPWSRTGRARNPGRARSVRRPGCRLGPDRPPNTAWWNPEPCPDRPRLPASRVRRAARRRGPPAGRPTDAHPVILGSAPPRRNSTDVGMPAAGRRKRLSGSMEPVPEDCDSDRSAASEPAHCHAGPAGRVAPAPRSSLAARRARGRRPPRSQLAGAPATPLGPPLGPPARSSPRAGAPAPPLAGVPFTFLGERRGQGRPRPPPRACHVVRRSRSPRPSPGSCTDAGWPPRSPGRPGMGPPRDGSPEARRRGLWPRLCPECE